MTTQNQPELNTPPLSDLRDQINGLESLILGLSNRATTQLAANKIEDTHETIALLSMATDILSDLNSISYQRSYQD